MKNYVRKVLRARNSLSLVGCNKEKYQISGVNDDVDHWLIT